MNTLHVEFADSDSVGRAVTLFLVMYASVGALACFPYHGKGGQLPVSTEPLTIVDAESQQPIEEVLVLPRYSSSSGLSTAAGHGPGAMSDTVYVTHPFLYRPDQPFAPSQPSSTGIVWGWFWGFTGTGKSIDGVLLVAPGYKSRWFYDLWSRRPAPPVAMTRLPGEEALAELKDIRRLLGYQIINGDSTLRWSLSPIYPLYIRIEASERPVVDTFLESGITKLGGTPTAPASVSKLHHRGVLYNQRVQRWADQTKLEENREI